MHLLSVYLRGFQILLLLLGLFNRLIRIQLAHAGIILRDRAKPAPSRENLGLCVRRLLLAAVDPSFLFLILPLDHCFHRPAMEGRWHPLHR